MPSHGHYQNEAAELSRHKTIHESESVLYETAIGSISGKTVIATTDTGSAITVDDLMEHLSAADFVIESHRDGGTGALDKLGRPHVREGVRTGRRHARKYPFFITTQPPRRGFSRPTEEVYYFIISMIRAHHGRYGR